jgi:DNA-binding LacI/PurR family transcriptional regulator
VISGTGHSSAASKEAVEAAVEALGFTPNQAARALASNRAHAVALVIPEPNVLVLADPFLGGIIIGISEAFHQSDYQLILIILRPDEAPDKAMRLLRPGHVDGAVVVSHHRTGPTEAISRDADLPVVYVGRPWAVTSPKSTYVDIDNQATGYLATNHLVTQGRRRIALLSGPPDMTPSRDRTQGYHQALEEAELTPGPSASGAFTYQGGEEAMKQILDSGTRFDAVFAQSDLMASGAMRVMTAAGLQIPSDVAVVGVDDSEIARSTDPLLTSVTNPAAELSLWAARLLLDAIESGPAPLMADPRIITPQLVIRQSA